MKNTYRGLFWLYTIHVVNEYRSDAPEDWAELVVRIKSGDKTGVERLYAWLNEGIRVGLHRRLGPQSVEDRLHEVLVIVLEAIRQDRLREPHRLLAYVRTVARRAIAAEIRGAVDHRRRYVTTGSFEATAPPEASPQARAELREKVGVVSRVMRRLRERDREILVRFYLHEQTPLEICRELSITHTQFRLGKSRAIARCFELTQRGRDRAVCVVTRG